MSENLLEREGRVPNKHLWGKELEKKSNKKITNGNGDVYLALESIGIIIIA